MVKRDDNQGWTAEQWKAWKNKRNNGAKNKGGKGKGKGGKGKGQDSWWSDDGSANSWNWWGSKKTGGKGSGKRRMEFWRERRRSSDAEGHCNWLRPLRPSVHPSTGCWEQHRIIFFE